MARYRARARAERRHVDARHERGSVGPGRWRRPSPARRSARPPAARRRRGSARRFFRRWFRGRRRDARAPARRRSARAEAPGEADRLRAARLRGDAAGGVPGWRRNGPAIRARARRAPIAREVEARGRVAAARMDSRASRPRSTYARRSSRARSVHLHPSLVAHGAPRRLNWCFGPHGLRGEKVRDAPGQSGGKLQVVGRILRPRERRADRPRDAGHALERERDLLAEVRRRSHRVGARAFSRVAQAGTSSATD